MRKPADVIPHLGAPHHYTEGRSAKLIAESWFAANGLPTMVQHVLSQSKRFAGAELVDAFLERAIPLRDGRRPSQADVLAIIGLPGELAVMAVEGKLDESFGALVSEWLVNASTSKHRRLAQLVKTLGLDAAETGPLRYQLLHRTASAVYEAHRYRVHAAVMMVHSFDPRDTGIEDFKRFATALGLPSADATRLVGPITREGVDLYLGWTADRASNEGFMIVNGRKIDKGLHEE
jgi:hypothetical protein